MITAGKTWPQECKAGLFIMKQERSHSIHTSQAKREQEVESGYQSPKPIPTDTSTNEAPPLKVPWSHKQSHQLGTKYSST